MVYLTTDDKKLNEDIAKYCIEKGILVNSADNYKNSSFMNMGYFKTFFEDVKVLVGISSFGKHPKKTKVLRDKRFI